MDTYNESMRYSHGCYDFIKRMIHSCETYEHLQNTENIANTYLKVCSRNCNKLNFIKKRKYKAYINDQIMEFQLLLNNQKDIIDSYNSKRPIKINGFG